jgi:hypothetical protein
MTGRPPVRSTKETVMAKAREITTGGAECVGTQEMVVDAARKMRIWGVGRLADLWN